MHTYYLKLHKMVTMANSTFESQAIYQKPGDIFREHLR